MSSWACIRRYRFWLRTYLIESPTSPATTFSSAIQTLSTPQCCHTLPTWRWLKASFLNIWILAKRRPILKELACMRIDLLMWQSQRYHRSNPNKAKPISRLPKSPCKINTRRLRWINLRKTPRAKAQRGTKSHSNRPIRTMPNSASVSIRVVIFFRSRICSALKIIF